MMTNVMVKTCPNQKIVKNSNLIQAMKNSVCPTANVTRKPIFSESRVFRSFRIVDWTHDMIIVKWSYWIFRKPNLSEYLPNVPKFPKCGLNTRHDNRKVTVIEFFESRICKNCKNIYRMFRSVDWTHDMIIVKWHLFIWHERKLCALTNAPPVQHTQTGQWLSTLFHVNFHANCSAAQVYVLHPWQFIFALSCRPRSFLQV